MRKLATVRKIDALTPIPGADAIECATVGGWKVVAQKGLYKEGDLAVYFEIDSWMPTALAPFLSKGKEPREFEGVKGERLKTIKLRGQLSQGLLIPLTELRSRIDHEVGVGVDVTEALGVLKWEAIIPAQLAGMVKGPFPSLIPKTDQERCQNLVAEIVVANESNTRFEITEKLDGSSMTVYRINGEFGVCSRNLDLKRDENNSLWAVAIADDIDAKMCAVDEFWSFAIQGEIVGPGIQGNIYKLSKCEFRVFDVYDIQTGDYLRPQARRDLITRMGLKHVPIVAHEADLYNTLGITDIPGLLKFAEGVTEMGSKCEREGVVFKEINGGMTFKAISNKFLLNND